MLRTPAVIALGITALFAAWISLDLGGPLATKTFDDLATTAVPLLASAACVTAALRTRAATRRGWALLGASAGAWALGNTVWSIYELGLGRDVPFPSLADAGYLAAVPLAALAMLAFPGASSGSHSRARALLDGAIISIALLATSWEFVLRSVYGTSTGGWLATAVGLAYPVGDVVVVSIVVYVASHVRPRSRLPFLLVAGGLVAMAFADSAFAYTTATGTYQTGDFLDLGWVIGYLLIALAALEAVAAPLADEPQAPHETSAVALLLPYAPLVVAIAAGITMEITEGALDPTMFWLAVAVFGAVLLRQAIVLRENLGLRRSAEAALRRLQQLESQRRQMLHNVTHDLATPLTPMRLHVEMMQQSGDELSAASARSLVVISRSIDQQARLVSDLRDLTRLEGRKLSIARATLALHQPIEAVVESYRELAASRGIALAARCDPDLVVDADSGRVSQVVTNLVTNALKFTPRGGRVTIEASARAGEAVIAVRDTGRGLSTDERSRLFQPFVQVHTQGSGMETGTGLGLFICRGIVNEHGGRLWVESEGPGHGASFLFTLPLAKKPLRLPEAQRAMELV
ncbi:MAG: sensor histidine kinase [Thermoplasmatota archaeon]